MASNGTAMPAIAVVSHDSLADLRRFLPGQARVAGALGVPLAVVDNASADGGAAYLEGLRESTPQLLLSLQPRNLGFAAAVNVAFSLVEDRDVLVLNPDVELDDPAGVRELARHMESHPEVGVCAPRLAFPDGSVQPSARRPASLAAMLGSRSAARLAPPLRSRYERYLRAATDGAGEADWVIGAAMLIRRSAFEGVGGMDEGFFLYMEDADLCRRMRRAGWDVAYVPSVTMRHDYRRASSAAGASALSDPARRRHIASLARYWRKHPGALIGRDARR